MDGIIRSTVTFEIKRERSLSSKLTSIRGASYSKDNHAWWADDVHYDDSATGRILKRTADAADSASVPLVFVPMPDATELLQAAVVASSTARPPDPITGPHTAVIVHVSSDLLRQEPPPAKLLLSLKEPGLDSRTRDFTVNHRPDVWVRTGFASNSSTDVQPDNDIRLWVGEVSDAPGPLSVVTLALLGDQKSVFGEILFWDNMLNRLRRFQ
eukprot:gene7377-7587_t